MSETYLNGKLTVSSLAAPTDDDQQKLAQLSSDERKEVLAEAIRKGLNSGVSSTSREAIWEKVLVHTQAKTNV